MLLPSGQVCPVEETNQMSRKAIKQNDKSTSKIAANWKKEERNLYFNGPREKIRTSFKLF